MATRTSITGTVSNVQINNSNIHVTGTNKEVQAPRVILSGTTLGVSLTTDSNVGVANISPIHTLDVGSNVFVSDAPNNLIDPLMRVRGLLWADRLKMGSSAQDGAVFFSNNESLSTDTGLLYDHISNVLTIEGGLVSNGAVDINASADIKHTLTLSDLTHSNIVIQVDHGLTFLRNLVANNTTLDGTLNVTNAATFDTTVDVNGTGVALTVSNSAVVGDTLTVNGAGVGLTVSNNATVEGVVIINGSGTGLTVSNNATIEGITVINGPGMGLEVANNAIIRGTMQVMGDLIVDGDLTVLTTNNLIVEDPIIELGNVNMSSGAQYDVGMIFTQPTGSNVATFYDISDSLYRVAMTSNTAHDTGITVLSAIEMEVTGNLTATTNLNSVNSHFSDTLSMGSGNILINGNSIFFT